MSNVPTLPTAAQPVLVASSVTTPVNVTSPVQIPSLGGQYTEYLNGLLALDTDYGRGVREGYALLTGGMEADVAIGCFAARCWAARQAQAPKTLDFGHGAEDVYRLLVENNLDVLAVIARVTS